MTVNYTKMKEKDLQNTIKVIKKRNLFLSESISKSFFDLWDENNQKTQTLTCQCCDKERKQQKERSIEFVSF